MDGDERQHLSTVLGHHSCHSVRARLEKSYKMEDKVGDIILAGDSMEFGEYEQREPILKILPTKSKIIKIVHKMVKDHTFPFI